MWDTDYGIMCKGLYSLPCGFNAVIQYFEGHLTRIYGPNSRQERPTMWEKIGAIRGFVMIYGAFNTPSLFVLEKKNAILLRDT